MDAPATLQIRRKPVAAPTTNGPSTSPGQPPSRQSGEQPPPLPARPGRDALRPDIGPTRPASRGEPLSPPLLSVPDHHRLRTRTSMPELSHTAADPAPLSPFDAAPPPAAATFGPGVSDVKKNFVQSAVSEARHFAGGLVPHPTESTKHYTILRHSPALIFYRGPTTSVAITIFSAPDRPLPADRTLWLQQRGYSGDSGMKIKAFFNVTDSWLHVTPSVQVQTDQLPPDTERAWQRDIAKAAKKLLKEKAERKAHVPRETHVIRIPEASDDGYFRLILCAGKEIPNATTEPSSKRKTLCTSPIFRVASTSSDSSIFRGASLSTMPLEMGVYVASIVASSTVDRYVAPVRTPVQAAIDQVRPGVVATTVGGIVRDELSERSAERDAEREQAWLTAHQAHIVRSREVDATALQAVGSDSGPEAPFPIKFQGKVVAGTGRSQAELGMPTANLAGVPDEVRFRLNGVYFGWARVLPKASRTVARTPTSQHPQLSPVSPSPTFEEEWHEAIITIAPCSPYARPSVAPAPHVAVHLLTTPSSLFPLSPSPSLTSPSSPTPHSPSHPLPFSPTSTSRNPLLGATLKVITMGLLHPHPPPPLNIIPIQDRLATASCDASLARASLARENWGPQGAEGVLAAKRRETSFSERVGGVVERVGARVPAFPVHWVGVRRGDGGERDRVRGVGGYWLRREG